MTAENGRGGRWHGSDSPRGGWDDAYPDDPLAGDAWRRLATVPQTPLQLGDVYEDVATGFAGAAVRFDKIGVTLEDRHGTSRVFPWGLGLLHEGQPVNLQPPVRKPSGGRRITASGSRAVESRRARVARESRIYVEGAHDAQLVVKVWGDDLAVEGVVIEQLDGVDHLAEAIRDFRPGAGRRMGVLVDHLVDGTKESHIVTRVLGACPPPVRDSVLVVGHPFIDVWAAVKPERLGLDRWPDVPRSVEWKRGIAAALGWPHATSQDISAAWKRILANVRTYRDLEPALLGRVEHLIDFVTGH